jgi:hypothetical protein
MTTTKNEGMKIQLDALNKHITMVATYFEEVQAEKGDFGEKLPRIIELLDNALGATDDALAECQRIE